MGHGRDENLAGHSSGLTSSSDVLAHRLQGIWAVATPEEGPGETYYPLASLSDGARLRAAVSGDSRRLLLIPVSSALIKLPSPGGALGCEFRSIVFNDAEDRFIEVSCDEPALFDVFDRLVTNIASAWSNSDPPDEAAVAVIDQWRKLLRGRPPLDPAVELGLYAELSVLSHVADTVAWDTGWWRGPLHESKDIVAPGRWIEVKGVGPGSTSISIHGLDQLDGVGTPGAGYVVIATVIMTDEGTTVEALASDLRTRCDDPELFDERMLRTGWVAVEPERRWALIDLSVIPAGVCPRITSENFPNGVPTGLDRVRYHLDIEVLRSLSLPSPQVPAALLGDSS